MEIMLEVVAKQEKWKTRQTTRIIKQSKISMPQNYKIPQQILTNQKTKTCINQNNLKRSTVNQIIYNIQLEKRYIMAEGLLKWLLITSITLVSTTLLMFVSAYIAIFNQMAEYYQTSVSNIVLLSNTFNIFYLIISPILFSWLKKYYSRIVVIASVLVATGCTARYLSGDNYNLALASSILVAISHIPIITAPYGLLGLFEPDKRGYASSIPLFLPALGINFCIFYGMLNITSQFPGQKLQQKQKYIQRLNFIIAVTGIVSALSTILLMRKLKKQIREINEQSDEGKRQTGSCLQQIKNQFTGDYRPFVVTVISWGTILGMNWTYGGMFGIFLDNTGLTRFQIALVGLFANLSSAVFCNLGNWISNTYKFSNTSIIFYLNIIGFLGSLFVQASSALPYEFFQNKEALILAVILLRAGFSSFVSLALMELNIFGPSVLVSSIFFYVANATNLGGNYIVDFLSNSKSLAIISALIWLSIFMVHLIDRTKIELPTGSVQIFSDDMISRKDQQPMTQLKSQGSIEQQPTQN